MIAALTSFVEELRAAGVPVSMVEAMDAARALRHVDLADRSLLRAALGATLVKDARHEAVFRTVFDVFFGLQPAPGDGGEEADAALVAAAGAGEGGSGGELDAAALAAALEGALQRGDRGVLEAAVRLAVSRLAGIEPGRPAGGTYYRYRVLRSVDLDGLRAALAATLQSEFEGPLRVRLADDEARRRIEGLLELLEREIRRRLVADRGAEAVARTLRTPPAEDQDLTTVRRDELAGLERVVRHLGRRLAVRLAQRRRRGRRGRLDVRSTVRRSLSYGGVPVDPRFRPPHPGKPEITLLCDVSGSVATFARFTMQLVHVIAAQFSGVRSFAFVDAVDEVTGFFGPGVDLHDAVDQIASEARVVWLDGHSDYGHVFGEFAERYLDGLSPRTTLIVVGDARTNYHPPHVAALAEIAEAVRAVYWLNPERRPYWGTGDSVIASYAPICDEVHEVRTLRQLERFVEQVALPAHRPVRRPGVLKRAGRAADGSPEG